MSRYFQNYDELGEYRGSLFDPITPAPKPFDQKKFDELLEKVAQAGREYGEQLHVIALKRSQGSR